MSTLVRYLLISGGTISVALAIAGVVLPLLPTTPFLLLAAYCYARSSERFHRWLIEHRWLGPYIDSYRAGRGLTTRQFVWTVVPLWLSIILAMTLVRLWWVHVILAACAIGVTLYLNSRRRLGRAARARAVSHEARRS